jgi:type VI secretion system secreted protein VgrG
MRARGKKFSFTSSGFSEDTFDVVSFSGMEGLSRLYRFDIRLVSEDDQLNLENVIQSRAQLTILREEGALSFNGILSEFEQMGTALGKTQYRAVLTPALWRHTLTHHNQVFLDKTVPKIIEAAMQDGGLTSLDYEFRLTGDYPVHEYICQYNESYYNFISRLMEREGLYYFFEQKEAAEKVIVTDSALLHSAMKEGREVYYSPLSGLDESAREEVIRTVVCNQKMLPQRVVLKDYNYRKPSVDITAQWVVSERGVGDIYIYGEHFLTKEEGTRLAKVRAEALKCRARVYHGESHVPYLRPGYVFQLDGHNRKDFNASYLTIEITHSGDQSFMFSAGIDKVQSIHEKSPYYRNSFTAISSENQFRPERITEKPSISGSLSAHIDTEGGGDYAEIDQDGRYKVRMPFDLAGSGRGKASSWLRMAQPYAGSDHGMHFPLHKDTEVLLTFIDGDPDRPVIAAAVPNLLTPSVVTSTNCTQNWVATAGGNKMHMEDQKGSQRIQFETPQADTKFRMGAPSANQSGFDSDDKAKAGIRMLTKGELEVEASSARQQINGNKSEIVTGDKSGTVNGDKTETVRGNKTEIIQPDSFDSVMASKFTLGLTSNTTAGLDSKMVFGFNSTTVVGGDSVSKNGNINETYWGQRTITSEGKKFECYKGQVYSSSDHSTLIGDKRVEILAGGEDPASKGYFKYMGILGKINIGLSAAVFLTSKLLGGKGVKEILNIEQISQALIATLAQLYKTRSVCKKTKPAYKSTMVLDSDKIEIKSDEIRMITPIIQLMNNKSVSLVSSNLQIKTDEILIDTTENASIKKNKENIAAEREEAAEFLEGLYSPESLMFNPDPAVIAGGAGQIAALRAEAAAARAAADAIIPINTITLKSKSIGLNTPGDMAKFSLEDNRSRYPVMRGILTFYQPWR